jgi:hypothetical protein
MKITAKIITATVGLLAILLLQCLDSARAGWSVNVSTTGSGTVTVKVTSSTGASNVVRTPFGSNPGAAINKQSNFTFTATGSLPPGASPETYVQVRAFANYKTSIQSRTVGGDLNDSDEVLQFVIPRSACASGEVEIEPIQTTADSITFQYRAKLSDEGSAVLLRVLDAVTLQQKYVVLLVGPYDNTDPSNCEGTITVTGNPGQLNLVLDGTTSTLPFNITCPGDMVLGCSAPVLDTYDPPAVATGETGPYIITYDPPPSQLVLGVTNTVTATARDTNGCTVSCQFKVYRQPISFDGFFSPLGGADATGGSCPAPLRTFKLGNVVPVKFKMTCNGVPVTTGVPIITIQGCTGNFTYQGPFHMVNDEWHFNIDSSVINDPGKYTITATLPDTSYHSVVLQYRR